MVRLSNTDLSPEVEWEESGTEYVGPVTSAPKEVQDAYYLDCKIRRSKGCSLEEMERILFENGVCISDDMRLIGFHGKSNEELEPWQLEAVVCLVATGVLRRK